MVSGDLRTRTRRWAVAFAFAMVTTPARADRPPPVASIDAPARRPAPPRTASKAHDAAPESASGWWVGMAGVAVALALCGWVSVAAKRYGPKANAASGGLRVVGRTSLSAKQSVYLLQVGDRVLIVGAGGQGAPSLLGELNDLEAVASLTGATRPRAGS